MADYYGPVLMNLTNATGVSVWCDAITASPYNETAVVNARASYLATEMIFRGKGDDIYAVADRIVKVLDQAVVMTSRFRKRVKALIRAKSGGSHSRKLYSGSGPDDSYSYNATTMIQFVDAADTCVTLFSL